MSSETVVSKVGNNLAVRRVGECPPPQGTRVGGQREGNSMVIEPVAGVWSDASLASAGTWDEPIERPGRNEPARDPFA